jgi:hypothetical protein
MRCATNDRRECDGQSCVAGVPLTVAALFILGISDLLMRGLASKSRLHDGHGSPPFAAPNVHSSQLELEHRGIEATTVGQTRRGRVG